MSPATAPRLLHSCIAQLHKSIAKTRTAFQRSPGFCGLKQKSWKSTTEIVNFQFLVFVYTLDIGPSDATTTKVAHSSHPYRVRFVHRRTFPQPKSVHRTVFPSVCILGKPFKSYAPIRKEILAVIPLMYKGGSFSF